MKAILAAIVAASVLSAAPADRYFGRLQMSSLRIRYETMQLKVRYETHKLLPEQTEHLALLTEDAFVQWSHAYPADPWLASTGYLLAKLYAELPGPAAAHHAQQLFVYVKSAFPSSHYAALSRNELHRGIPVRPDPAWAADARAAMAPSPSPSPSATAAPIVPASPLPAATSTARPTPPTRDVRYNGSPRSAR